MSALLVVIFRFFFFCSKGGSGRFYWIVFMEEYTRTNIVVQTMDVMFAWFAYWLHVIDEHISFQIGAFSMYISRETSSSGTRTNRTNDLSAHPLHFAYTSGNGCQPMIIFLMFLQTHFYGIGLTKFSSCLLKIGTAGSGFYANVKRKFNYENDEICVSIFKRTKSKQK